MKKTAVALVALAGSLLIPSGPIDAHHSMAMFEEDPARRLMLKGTVVQWVWANPHCLLDAVTVTVRPIRSGKPLGLMVQVPLADGRTLMASGSGNARAAAPAPR